MRAHSKPASAASERPHARIELAGIALDALRETECVEHVARSWRSGVGGWIVTPNLDHLRRLVRDTSFRTLCAGADLAVADGMPLVWASRLQRTPLPERVAGSDLIASLSASAAREGKRVFFLGGDPGTAEETARVLGVRHRDLVVAGTACPQPGFDADPAALEALIARVVDARPDLVFVALGSPKQERLIATLRPHLARAWLVGIGISFSFVAGSVKRAPPWVRALGLEWSHRLMQEPRRLAGRYLVDGIPFATLLFARCAWRGLGATSAARRA